MRTHPFGAKIGIWHQNPENVKTAIERQLNAGHVNVSMEGVESPQEVRDIIKAMRLTSAGGTRPETGLEKAAEDSGRSVDEYKRKSGCLAAQQKRGAPHHRDHREHPRP